MILFEVQLQNLKIEHNLQVRGFVFTAWKLKLLEVSYTTTKIRFETDWTNEKKTS